MLDFNTETAQREFVEGPVPAGSRVLVKLTLERPQHTTPDHEYVSKAKTGLLGLWVKYEVASGAYQGVRWYENLWLPQGMQKIDLDAGRRTACNVSGAKMRAILEAAKGVMPKDDSPKAARARQVSDWLDFMDLTFPVRVGIDKQPVEKDGRTYWNNSTVAIITPDKAKYAELMRGGEIIVEGPITGGDKAPALSSQQAAIPGWDTPPVDTYDDMPF